MAKGIEILYWNSDQVSGDWDAVYFESLKAVKEAGRVIDEVKHGGFFGHYKADMVTTRIAAPAAWTWKNRLNHLKWSLKWGWQELILPLKIRFQLLLNKGMR